MEDGNAPTSAASEIAATFSAEAVEETENQTIAGEEIKEHSSDDDGFNRKFAALSRQEKEFRDERTSWQQEKAELEEYRAAKAAESEAPQMSIEQRLKRDPLGTLKDLGLSYDRLTELALNDGKLDSESLMNNKLDDMNAKWEETYGSKIKQLEDQLAEKAAAEVNSRQEAAVQEYKGKIESHITENTADFELISAYKANDLVFDVIETHYNETNRVLEISDACKAVEEHLLSEYKKLGKINKLQPEQETKPNLFESPPTLSNAQSAQASTTTERKLTNEESKANAASLIRWD